MDLARPASVITADDETLFADPAPPEPDRVGLVVATSGTAGSPKLVELSRPAVAAAVGLSFAALGPAVGPASRSNRRSRGCAASRPHTCGGHARPDASRRVRHAGDRARPDRAGPATPVHEVPAGAHVALVPTMLHRLVEAGDRPLAVRHPAGRRGGRGRRIVDVAARARRPRGVDVRSDGDVRRHRVRRPALRRHERADRRDGGDRAPRADADGGLPTRPRGDGGRVHVGRMAAHGRHGRAGARRSAPDRRPARTRRSGRAPKRSGRRRSKTRSATIRRSPRSRWRAGRTRSGDSRSWRSSCR